MGVKSTGASPSGKALGFGPSIPGFESLRPSHDLYPKKKIATFPWISGVVDYAVADGVAIIAERV